MLTYLLNNSEVIEIESDAVPFTHKFADTQTRDTSKHENHYENSE